MKEYREHLSAKRLGTNTFSGCPRELVCINICVATFPRSGTGNSSAEYHTPEHRALRPQNSRRRYPAIFYLSWFPLSTPSPVTSIYYFYHILSTPLCRILQKIKILTEVLSLLHRKQYDTCPCTKIRPPQPAAVKHHFLIHYLPCSPGIRFPDAGSCLLFSLSDKIQRYCDVDNIKHCKPQICPEQSFPRKNRRTQKRCDINNQHNYQCSRCVLHFIPLSAFVINTPRRRRKTAGSAH